MADFQLSGWALGRSTVITQQRRHGSGNETHAAQQTLETRIGAQRRKERVYLEQGDQGLSACAGLIQKLECTVFIAQSEIERSQVESTDMALAGWRREFTENLQGALAFAP